MMKLLGWSSSTEYGCESAPNDTGKKEGVPPPFHVVALLGHSRAQFIGTVLSLACVRVGIVRHVRFAR